MTRRCCLFWPRCRPRPAGTTSQTTSTRTAGRRCGAASPVLRTVYPFPLYLHSKDHICLVTSVGLGHMQLSRCLPLHACMRRRISMKLSRALPLRGNTQAAQQGSPGQCAMLDL